MNFLGAADGLLGLFGSQQSNFSMYLSTLQLALKPLMFVSDVLSGSTPPTDLSVTPIPSYVLEYAPLIWLHSQDPYRPSDIAQQLAHTTPMVNWTAVQDLPAPASLSNLESLNEHGNTSVFLTSKEGIDADPQPAWLYGDTFDQNKNTGNTISSVVVTRDHGNDTLDAFYFYFYAYNEGNTVLGMEFGNHIGDWEHNMIRFENATPQAIWYNQHTSGQAFTYSATEKQGKRPLGYSGKGTHATYSTPGNHDHTIPHLNLPAGFLVDKTDRGILWDPTESAYAYSYEPSTKTFQAYDPSFPVSWLYYNGQWGDDALPGGPELFGQKKWAGGPNGPKFKHLEREEVCPSHPCVVLPFRSWEEGEGVPE